MEKLIGKLWLLSSCLLAASATHAVDVPEMLKDINQAGYSVNSAPIDPHIAQGRVILLSDDGAHGLEPWVYDPATGQARLLVDSVPGVGSTFSNSFENRLEVINSIDGRVSVFRSHNGRMLWRTDGTSSGTFVLKQGLTAWEPRPTKDGRIYFGVEDRSAPEDIRMVTDGTAEGTSVLAAIDRGPLLFGANYKSALYAVQYRQDSGWGLWRKEPGKTSELVKLIMPGSGEINDDESITPAVMGGLLYFVDKK